MSKRQSTSSRNETAPQNKISEIAENEINEVVEMKCGIEIHQQLNTGKLFCRCPSILRSNPPHFTIKRKLHVVAGESGAVDIAAKHEAGKEMTFVYECYKDNTCLVEMDEEPPHEMDKEALKIVIQIALLLNCEILPLTQIMRKTVIDGSNTSGFQRTALIARKGYIETASGRVGIDSICLEEDAARIIRSDEKENIRVFRLDRLGIPLVEIATAPDIKTPEQAKEVALHIGEVLRASNVKRGIGTIRQDVNVSAGVNGKWGARIEIKGVQEPALIEQAIIKEIERQKEMIAEGKSTGEVRKANEDGSTNFLRPLPGAARMYPETDLPILRISREEINEAKKSLPKLKSEMRGELSRAGLSPEFIKLIIENNKLAELQELLRVYQNPNLIAKLLVLWPSEVSSKTGKDISNIEKMLTLDVLETILFAVKMGKISESNARESLVKIISGEDVKKALVFEKAEDLEEKIMKIVKEKPGLTKQAYMGLIMKELRGRVSGKEVMDVLNAMVK